MGLDASAADPGDVESLIRDGADLRRQGKDERALPFFQKAYAMDHTPRTAGQLGLAEMAVGYWLSAESHLVEGLEAAGHPWIAKNREVLTQALAQVRQKIGEVSITGGPTGAVVRVNGHEAGTLPLASAVRVEEGRVLIEVSAPGYRIGSSRLHIVGGAKEKVAITLVPDSAPEVAPSAKLAKPAEEQVSPISAEPSEPAVTKGSGRAAAALEPGSVGDSTTKQPSSWAYATAGLAAVSLVFAVIETVRWKSKESEFSNHTGAPATMPSSTMTVGCGRSDPGRGAVGCDTIYESGRMAWALSLAGYGVGAVLAAGSIYLFAAGTKGTPTDPQTSLACGPTSDLRMAICSWRF